MSQAKEAPKPAAGGKRARIAVLISGRGSNMGALIAASMKDDFPARIVRVISDRPDARGLETARGFDIAATAIARKDFADKAAHEAAILAALAEADCDYVCLAGYMRLLSADFISRWNGRIINIHPSLLPAFPGLDTHHRAIAAGCRIHGASVHFVTEGMDEGPVFAQAAVPVMTGDTPETLAARVLKAEHLLYPAALAMLVRGEVRMGGDGGAVFSEPASEAGNEPVLLVAGRVALA